jgi:hypothetical protein
VCGAKQIKQPTTTMDQAIIIIPKAKTNNSDKKHNRNCLPSSVLMNLHLGERELSFPLSKLRLTWLQWDLQELQEIRQSLISTLFPNFFMWLRDFNW